MAKYKIGDRVEYVVDGVVEDTGTILYKDSGNHWWARLYKDSGNHWWARWDSDGNNNTFNQEDAKRFRKVEYANHANHESTPEWIENTSTRNIRPVFLFEFLMSDGTVRQGSMNILPGIDWNTNKEDDGYPHVVKYRMIGAE